MPIVKLDEVDLHYVSVDSASQNAASRGDIVMLHGLGANLGFWFLRIAPAFASDHRVTMLDLRGHGLSSMPGTGYTPERMAGDVVALLDYLGIESAHIVGHSFGAAVGLHCACNFPERVGSLVVADLRLQSIQSRLRLSHSAFWPRYREAVADAGIEINEETFDFGFELFEQLAVLRLEQPAAIEKLQAVVPSPFAGKTGKRSAIRWLKLLHTTSAGQDFRLGDGLSLEKLEKLSKPTLLIYGEYSQALPTAHALHELWKDSRLEIVPRAGHFFPMSAPDRLIGPARRFIEAGEDGQAASMATGDSRSGGRLER